jgi:hypothetical protein
MPRSSVGKEAARDVIFQDGLGVAAGNPKGENLLKTEVELQLGISSQLSGHPHHQSQCLRRTSKNLGLLDMVMTQVIQGKQGTLVNQEPRAPSHPAESEESRPSLCPGFGLVVSLQVVLQVATTAVELAPRLD